MTTSARLAEVTQRPELATAEPQALRPAPVNPRLRSAARASGAASSFRRLRRSIAALRPRETAQAPLSPYPVLHATPKPRPLPMERQDLRRAARTPFAGAGVAGRRWFMMLTPCAIASFVAVALAQALSAAPTDIPAWTTIVLSTMLSWWLGFGFASAVGGFVAAREPPAPASAAEIRLRTAILLPAHDEDPGQILAAVEAIGEDLRRHGAGGLYDVFILSDTRQAATAREEAVGFLRLSWRLAGGPGVYYRRRAINADRKAGNIADWVKRHGAGYAFMLVLDADSLMSAQTILALTSAMQRDPRLGLLQTAPVIVGATTPFARWQQFASHLYGPVAARGQQWWSGAEGNYWGHNAIIRVAAFAESAGLPHLSGPRPWGGHIMSHDFVEAALLRRRGWAVRMAASLGGSFEETPPSLLDMAARDRRWCQGNLQHARLLACAGLHWVSRLHLILGIFSYLAPPMWLALIVCSAAVWPGRHPPVGSLRYDEVIALFGLSLALLVVPKLLPLASALACPARRSGFGGGPRLIAGFVTETLASILFTPVLMVMQSVALLAVIAGRDGGWRPQRRQAAGLSDREAWRAHRAHVVFGVGAALAAVFLDRYLLVWAGPVFLSLALSAVLSARTSRPSPRAGRRLLCAPVDVEPAPVVARAMALRDDYARDSPLRRQIERLFEGAPAPHEPKLWARAARDATQAVSEASAQCRGRID